MRACHSTAHALGARGMMEVSALGFAQTDMINTVAGLLLIAVIGMCVVAFPFVLGMLFGDAPRFRYRRRTSRQRESVPAALPADVSNATRPQQEASHIRKKERQSPPQRAA